MCHASKITALVITGISVNVICISWFCPVRSQRYKCLWVKGRAKTGMGWGCPSQRPECTHAVAVATCADHDKSSKHGGEMCSIISQLVHIHIIFNQQLDALIFISIFKHIFNISSTINSIFVWLMRKSFFDTITITLHK